MVTPRSSAQGLLMKRIVLTGAPGAGKTTLLHALRTHGYAVMEESARDIIQSRRARELPPRPHPLEFAQEVLRRDIEKYGLPNSGSDLVFFDRGVLDALCMLDQVTPLQENELSKIVLGFPYHRQVFFLPPWADIYTNDAERDQTFDDAIRVHENLSGWYRRCGYEVIEVPKTDVAERCAYVLETIAEVVQPSHGARPSISAGEGIMTKFRKLAAIALAGASCLACGGSTSPEATDVDGHTYQIVRVGSQTWFAENLRVTRTPAGEPLSTFAPNDDTANIAAFGRLYSWESACRACPTGWHLPSDAEWMILERFLGSTSALRLRDREYWPAETVAVENLVPFRARPAGYSNDQGFDNFFGSRAVFWTASRHDPDFVWSRVVSSDQDALRRAPQHPQYGFSVRCVRDE